MTYHDDDDINTWRDRPGEIEITREDQDRFEEMFQEWRDSWPTAPTLEAGGVGDLEVLSRRALEWATRLLSRRTPLP